MTDNYKLFVVGESSPDPENWSIWSEYSLVIAKGEDEARRLAEKDGETPVAEIPLTAPLYILTQSEPNWGEDL